ncbi:MAG: AtpZ/AtpI family protein [Actinomycetota bacterium]
MRLRLRSQDLQGLDDGFTRALELVLTPVVFALIGLGIDALAGTTPLFTIGLAVFAIVGESAVMWYRYDATMREHERELQERRRGPAASGEAGADRLNVADESRA